MVLSTNFRLTPIAIFVIASISACSDSADNEPGGSAIDDSSDGQYLLCHDSNHDASCDASESAQSFGSLADATAAEASAGKGPVVIRGDDGTLLFGEAQSSSASAWSTLLNNEKFFNPHVGAEEGAIVAYLEEHLNLSGSELSDAEASDFASSVASAVSAYPLANPYVVVAAVVDAAVLQGSLSDAIPSAEQVEKQVRLERRFDQEPVATTKATWEVSDGDERVNFISSNDNSLLVINRWHNRLAIVAKESIDQPVDTQVFAAMGTAGHNEYTTDADYISGASEHRINWGWVSNEGDSLYALVSGSSEHDVPEDDSYGLFRVPLDGGQLPTHQVTSVDGVSHWNVPHRASGVVRIASKNLTDAIVLDNGNVLAFDEEAGFVRVYDSSLLEDTGSAFPLDTPLRSWALSDGGESLLVLHESVDGSDAVLASYNTDDLNLLKSTTVASSSTDILSSKSSEQVLVLDGKKISILNSKTLVSTAEISLQGEPSSLSKMSPDGLRAALIYNSQINVLNLTEAHPFIEGVLAYNGRSLRALAFNGDDEIVYSSSQGTLESLSLAGLSSTPVSTEETLVESIESIDEDDINHGYGLEAVIYPMDLPASYGSSTFEWSSASGNVSTVVASLGEINQPSAGQKAVSDTLSVKSVYEFRGESTSSETVSYEVTIRPEAELRAHTLTPAPTDIAGKEVGEMAASAQGAYVAVYAQDEATGKSGISVLQKNDDQTLTSVLPLLGLPAGYEDSSVELIFWSGTTVHVVVQEAIAAGEKEGDGIGRILSLDAFSATWTVGAAQLGIVDKGAVSQDGSAIALWMEVPVGQEAAIQIKTLNVNDLTEIATIPLIGEAKFWQPEVSNDGQFFFTYFNYKNEDGDTVRETRRYNAGLSGEYSATTIIEDATYSYAYDHATDVLVTGDFDSKLRVYTNAAAAADLDIFTEFETARGGFDNTGSSGRGRMYDGRIANNIAYLWSSGKGLIAIDISDPNAPVEKFYAPLAFTGSGSVSPDGSTAYTFSYDDDTLTGQFAVIDLTAD